MADALFVSRLNILAEERLTRDCERDFRVFVREAFTRVLEPSTSLEWSFALDAMGDHLMGMHAGHILELLITIPSRFLKSTVCGVCFPAWRWGPAGMPWLRMIYASYGKNLSIRDSVYTRKIIESQWYQERWGTRFSLTTDQNVKSNFHNDRSGFRMAGSFQRGVTGEGGHFIGADDPHDLVDDTNVKAIERNCAVFTGTLTSRLNDRRTGQKLVVMQRVASNDLASKLIASGTYVHLNLPMEYARQRHCVTVGSTRPLVGIVDGKDVVLYPAMRWQDPRTEEKALLAPERFDLATILKMKSPTELGLRKFETQANQNPQTTAGIIYHREHWKYWTVLPGRFDEVLQSWDMTFKDEASSDHVVGQVWGRLGGEFYLLAQIRDQLSFSGSIAAVENMSALWPTAYRKLIEDKANGPAIINVLRKKISGIKPVEPNGSKIARAWASQPFQEAGNVYLPAPGAVRMAEVLDADGQPIPLHDDQGNAVLDDGKPVYQTAAQPLDTTWVPGFVEEHANFRGLDGQPDDQVDAQTQAIAHFAGAIRPRIRSAA